MLKNKITFLSKKLSKKLLPLSFVFCFANSNVLTPAASISETSHTKKSNEEFENSKTEDIIDIVETIRKENLKLSWFEDFVLSEDLSQKILLLSTKYNENTDYKILSDFEKDEIFDIQDKLFSQLRYKPYERFIYEEPMVYRVREPGPYYYEQDPRHFNEWWGANLWVNLTKSETEWWINLLKEHNTLIKGAVSFLSTLTGFIIDKITTQLFIKSFESLDFITKTINIFINSSIISKLIDVIFELIYQTYFNWEVLTQIASSNGTISYRFTFGFIPTGVHPGYKVVD